MPVTTRSRGTTPRKPAAEEQTMSQTASQELPRSQLSSMQSSTLKPSPYYLLIYVAILAAGSLYSQISPDAGRSQATLLAPGISSGVNNLQTRNYFAGKHNLLNIYFVKIGWFWTTLAFTLLQVTTRPSSRPLSRPNHTHYIQSTTRYAIVTLAWILTTQWLFGPPLIDRSFTITGGHCEARPAKLYNEFEGQVDHLTSMTSSTACKSAGGRWRGGHDISGHVFMLVLSSAFLLLEVYLSDRHSAHPHVSDRAAAAVAKELSEEERTAVGGWESENMAKFRMYSRYGVWAVVALDLWMLMMTAIWFHTWLEKLSGLLIASSTLFVVYWASDFLPAWKRIVGGL